MLDKDRNLMQNNITNIYYYNKITINFVYFSYYAYFPTIVIFFVRVKSLVRMQ